MTDYPLYPETGSHHDTPHPASERGEVEQLASEIHAVYEEAALKAGWQTQPRSRVPWSDVPPENQEATRAVARYVLATRRAPTPQGGQGVEEALNEIDDVTPEIYALIAAVRAEEHRKSALTAEYRIGKLIHQTRAATLAEVREKVVDAIRENITMTGSPEQIVRQTRLVNAILDAMEDGK